MPTRTPVPSVSVSTFPAGWQETEMEAGELTHQFLHDALQRDLLMERLASKVAVWSAITTI